eukprot:2500280-Rhodomonas_salina.2
MVSHELCADGRGNASDEEQRLVDEHPVPRLRVHDVHSTSNSPDLFWVPFGALAVPVKALQICVLSCGLSSVSAHRQRLKTQSCKPVAFHDV